MSSIRVYELAKRHKMSNRELLDLLRQQGIAVKSHMSTVDEKTEALVEKLAAGKHSDSSSQEKKVNARTYIPPRRRQRKKQDAQGKSDKPRTGGGPQTPTGRERPKRPQKPQKRSPGKERPVESSPKPSARSQRKPKDSRQKDMKSSKKPESFRKEQKKPQQERASGGRPSREQKKDVDAQTGGKTEETTRKRTQEGTSRRGGKPQERGKKKYVPLGDQQRKGKPSARKQKQGEVEDSEVAKKKSLDYHKQKDSLQQNRRPKKKPQRRPVSKTQKRNVKAAAAQAEETPKRLEIPEVITVKELAGKMSVPPAKIIRHLMTMGIMANVNQVLNTEAAVSIAEHFEFEAKAVSTDEEKDISIETVDESKLKPRPPVVTIMGHVDHGKTTLLDAIRESKIIDSEFGGITQHIGAYSVDVHDQQIVFLDTPGHEAFTAMRARGAKVTDEVVLVVAADDGIMPQTIEAIDHARAAEVPIIVAINKMDVPGANPDRVMQELTKYGLTPEDWGGETICVRVSAKQREHLDDLLEMIVLQAEILELKADPDRSAQGVIVEALLDKGRGPVATVLVQNGTLRIGDPFVVGLHHGKVRAMLDDRGKRVQEVGPATPVEVLGLTGVPVAGDPFLVVENERRARQIAESRQEQQQKTEFAKTAKITLEELHHHIKDGETQELRIVIKADVHGSVEALSDSLERLSTEKVRLRVIHGGVGAINESDVMLASASNAIVLGFNVRPVAKAQEMAEKEQIDVRLYTVIYQAIEDIKKAMEGLLEPTYKEVLEGQALVQALFTLPKYGTVAGCRVTNGKVTRNSLVRLLRGQKELFKGSIASLRRVKDDVREVQAGYECGIRLENCNDIQEGDVIEAYTLEKVAMTL